MSPDVAIYAPRCAWHERRLLAAFAACRLRARVVAPQACRLDLGAGAAVHLPGFGGRRPAGVFVRGVPGGSLEEIVFHLDVLHALEALGVPVYNDARTVERSVDKGLASFLLSRAGLPSPPTWVLRNARQAEALVRAESRRGHRTVVKPLFGSRGKGLRLIERPAGLPDVDSLNGVYYLQRYIDLGPGQWHDWRVFVIHGRAVAAMRRDGQSWITNLAQGARAQPALLGPALRALAERSAAALSMRYAGVDIMRDRRGDHWVLEANGIPAWKGLQAACGVDIAALLAGDFRDYCETFHKPPADHGSHAPRRARGGTEVSDEMP